jgi:hypothetical protein
MHNNRFLTPRLPITLSPARMGYLVRMCEHARALSRSASQIQTVLRGHIGVSIFVIRWEREVHFFPAFTLNS